MERNRTRTLLSLVGLGLAAALMAGLFEAPAQASTAGTPDFEEVLNLVSPPRTLTVADLTGMAERAVQRPLPLPSQAQVLISDHDLTWSEVDAALAGQGDPNARVVAVIDNPAPQSTVGDIMASVPGPLKHRTRLRIRCGSGCTITVNNY